MTPSRLPHRLLLALSAAFPCIVADAAIDELPLQLNRERSAQLRWDNVEPTPDYWQGGVAPQANFWAGRHHLDLAPGASTIIRLPAGEQLRVVADAGALAPDALTFSRSKGNGLEQVLKPQIGQPDGSLLLAGDADEPSLLHIRRPATAQGSIRVALFVSRQTPPDALIRYRKLLAPEAPPVEVQSGHFSAAVPYWLLSAGKPIKLLRQRQQRLAIDLRAIVPRAEAAREQHLEITLRTAQKSVNQLIDTNSEHEEPIWMDGKPAVVSRRERIYFDLPPYEDGKAEETLQLESSFPVLVRVVGYSTDDYLFPTLNSPSPPAELSPTEQGRSDAVLALTQADLSGRQGWRDNELQKAALASLGVLEQQTREFTAYPEVTSTLRQFRNHATFYRNLLPNRTIPPGELHLAYYTPPQLRGLGAVPLPLSAAEQHWAALQAAIPSGLFLAVGGPPPAMAADRAYDLPERYAPSDLRVVIHAPEHQTDETIYLQIDQQAPQALLVSPPPAVPAASFTDTLSALALRLQGDRWPARSSTQSGLFVAATAASPAPHITAGVVELPLSSTARRVRLWRENPGGAPLYAALQYRASKPYGLAESAWPSGVEGAPARQIIASLLASPDAPSDAPINPAAEAGTSSLSADPTAISQFRSLARLLDASRRATLASLPAAADGAAGVPADGGAAAYAEAVAASDPLAALEAAVSATGRPESERYWLISELLLRLDEPHLALQRWRQLAWFAADATQRAQVRRRLDQYFQQQNDGPARIQLHAAAVAQGDVEALIPLAHNLFDEGDAEAALKLLRLIEPASRPPELVLAIAYANQWWQLFEETMPTLADPQRRAYWQAYRQQARGIKPDALFAVADAEGQALAQHGQQAAALQQAAADRSPAENLAAWSRWAFAHPGPRRWRDASTLVSDTAGAVHVYQIDRDLHQNAFLASAQTPLRLGFPGPRRLRIEARPLHPAAATDPIDGWLRIRSADGLWLEPITDNVPAESVQISTESASRPGRSVERELFFGPGWHELAIDGEQQPLIVRVRQQEPWRPLAHLAAPTPNTTLLPATAAPPDAGTIPLGWCVDCSEIVTDDQASSQRWRRFDLGVWQGRDALARPRPAGLVIGEAPLPPDPARLLASKEPAALLELPPPDAASVRERSIALLWLAEKNPAWRERVLAQALAWAQTWPGVPGLNPVIDRIARRSGWSAVSAVTSSAGRRGLAVDGSRPESPALRVRSALLPALAPHERRLSGEGRWVLALENPTASQLDISLRSEELMLPLGPPMLVQIQVDQAPARIVSLATGDLKTTRLGIPKGRHSVSIGIVDPVANQFLRIGVLEGGQKNIEVSERTYHVAMADTPIEVKLAGPAWLRLDELKEGLTESTYRYLPEPWQNVRVAAAAGQSEALFRLFLRRVEPNRPITRTRQVALAPQALPLPGSVPDRPPGPTTVRLIDGLALAGQEDGTWTVSAVRTRRPQFDDQPAPLLVHDEFVELSASWRYFAADSRRYYRTELLGRGRDSGAPTLGLRGEVSGPLGASPVHFILSAGAYLQRPDPAALASPLPAPLAAGEAALPRRGEPGTEGGAEMAASLQQTRQLSPRSWHLPRVTAFAHWQSLDENTRTDSQAAEQFFADNLAGSQLIGRSDFLRRHALYAEEGLDHDVFSAYRADHPFGIRFSDTYYQRPWLDTLWYTGASVTSNADLRFWKPDHLSVRVGWQQMLGPLHLNAEYELFRYLPDKHRQNGASLDAVRFGIFGEHWRSAHQRSELGAELSYDLARKAGGIVVYWRLDFGNGRGFRDYRPGDINFHELRERRQSDDNNNRIEPDDPR